MTSRKGNASSTRSTASPSPRFDSLRSSIRHEKNSLDLQRAERLGHRVGQYGVGGAIPVVESSAEDLLQRVKIYRVQGGESRQMITVSETGNITDVNDEDFIYISIADELAEAWKGKENRAGAKVLVLEVSADFLQALTITNEARKRGLPPAQPSQDKKWKGQSYAIKGPAWAAFLRREQERGLSREWDISDYLAQFEVEVEPDDQDTVLVYEDGDEEDAIELTYAEYKQSFSDWNWKWPPS